MTPNTLLQHLDSGQPWPADTPPHTDLPAAYQAALAVRALRAARGEQPRGYKIGFTNRTIWERYAVYAPIWGTVWSSTLVDGGGVLDLHHCCQPRLEPEVVFGLRATPADPGDLQALYEAIDWVATGFEVVQSHRPDWRFSAADTVADSGLHARLYLGPRQPVAALAAYAAGLDAALAAASVTLERDGQVVDQGTGANVLGSPLQALRHFAMELQACPGAPVLAAGDIITTGTWTDAWPVAPGQRWVARFGAPLREVGVVLEG
jgi:2-oxo-3-hexenedioate decarboxylase